MPVECEAQYHTSTSGLAELALNKNRHLESRGDSSCQNTFLPHIFESD